jgi:CubicO group peptidase (beta-lactamase class C family)
MRRILRLAVVLVAALATPSPVEAQGRPLDGLDEWISRGLKDWSTPGLTLAVVHRDSVLLAKGYGVREFGRSEPVDENTLFSIGSCSKAFTSATIAGLVGDGRVGWEDRAIDHLPWFRLWDPWVTEHVTVRDLMAHRVGADLTIENPIWPFATSMKDLVLRGGRQQPASGFRERYHYSNNMFVAAGLVAEAASGLPFARALQDRILVPLGMSSTRLSIQDALATRSDRRGQLDRARHGAMAAIPARPRRDRRATGRRFGGVRPDAHSAHARPRRTG